MWPLVAKTLLDHNKFIASFQKLACQRTTNETYYPGPVKSVIPPSAQCQLFMQYCKSVVLHLFSTMPPLSNCHLFQAPS